MKDSLQWIQDKYDIPDIHINWNKYSAVEVAEFIEEYLRENIKKEDMIHKNKTFGKVDNVTILEFKGDIAIAPAGSRDSDYETCVFKSWEPQEIGKEIPGTGGMETDDFAPDVVMLFRKPESIDVVIEALQRAKEKLIQKSVNF